jgi:predicted metal-binding transcription factor (methanogenesis marker protein 9)
MKMKPADIQKKAKGLGITPDKKMKTADLVRAIQTAEGNRPCFNTAVVNCPHTNCCFRENCDATMAQL